MGVFGAHLNIVRLKPYVVSFTREYKISNHNITVVTYDGARWWMLNSSKKSMYNRWKAIEWWMFEDTIRHIYINRLMFNEEEIEGFTYAEIRDTIDKYGWMFNDPSSPKTDNAKLMRMPFLEKYIEVKP